jgi:glycosyltransferase involved in cell wall biosynthesis
VIPHIDSGPGSVAAGWVREPDGSILTLITTSDLPPEPRFDSAAPRELELTVVLPCLNEAETLATCVRRALDSMATLGVVGEVLVADNGSTDGSQQIARDAGARVVNVPQRGYGAALNHGIAQARSPFVIMADADDSYALEDLGPFLDALRQGADLVMGNRFRGGIASGAMPALHRYLGNPVLSRLGRLFFSTPIGDFHCGIRGMRRESILNLALRTTGMEYASEMVVRASLKRLSITEVPTLLRRDGRTRPPHLRTWRDGWRHLRFLLAFSPRWLLWYPSLLLVGAGTLVLLWLSTGEHQLAGIGFGVHTMLAAATAVCLGVQIGALAVLSRSYAAALGLLPRPSRFAAMVERWMLNWGVLGGFLAGLGGVGCYLAALLGWQHTSFGGLDAASTLRLPILGMVLIVLGAQTVLLSFGLSLTRIGEA